MHQNFGETHTFKKNTGVKTRFFLILTPQAEVFFKIYPNAFS